MATDVEKLRESIDWLVKNNYLVSLDNRLYITSRVYRDLEVVPKTPQEDIKSLATKKGYKEEDFKKFITDAAIPNFINTEKGRYRCNAYSGPAAKEFVRMLKSGVMYEVLLEGTKRYYKNTKMPKTVANYILEEVWRTPYDDILSGVKDTPIKSEDHRKLL